MGGWVSEWVGGWVVSGGGRPRVTVGRTDACVSVSDGTEQRRWALEHACVWGRRLGLIDRERGGE